MVWKTEKNFEKDESTIRAVYSTESNAVYYITDASVDTNDWDASTGYILSYWPDRQSKIETVTLVDTFDELESAKNALVEKTDSSVFN